MPKSARSLPKRLIDAAWAFAADVKYRADGFATSHAADFLSNEEFAAAYRAGLSTNPAFGRNLHVEWRLFVGCWAAEQALLHGADLVECGVNTGLNALTVARYLQLDKRSSPPAYFLLDTFRGIPEQQAEGEERLTVRRLNRHYTDCYADVVRTFSAFPSVKVIQGVIPQTLDRVKSERIGYLAIDLNVALPERAALECFWDRLVPGAVVVLDDHGWTGHETQRAAHQDFARRKGVTVLPLPTGQGIILKP